MEQLQRVAAYIRVSTEEQKKKGYSIETQRANITEYLSKQDNMALVDFYVDEGISANKLKKRAALQRLLEDVKAKKIDMIIFTKLDRWFRSVQKYYQIQEVLDNNNVVWKTIHEDYETATSSGKFKVNIMLSVAQNERDKCSERITDVFKYRVKEGYAVTGAQPFGFKVENKKVVIDEEKREIVNALIDYYESTNSLGKTLIYLQQTYGINIYSYSLVKLLRDTKLYGKFRDNDNYCEPYITKERFDKIQRMMQSNIREKKNNYYYIFSSLLLCSECNHRLAGTHSGNYSYYRCNHHANQRKCNNGLRVKESNIEKYLLENVEPKLKDYICEIEMQEAVTKTPKSNKNEIKRRLNKLFELYMNNCIEIDKYKVEYDYLTRQIVEEPEVQKKDLTAHKEFLQNNILFIYQDMTLEEKQAVWRSIIKAIIVKGNEVVDIVFL